MNRAERRARALRDDQRRAKRFAQALADEPNLFPMWDGKFWGSGIGQQITWGMRQSGKSYECLAGQEIAQRMSGTRLSVHKARMQAERIKSAVMKQMMDNVALAVSPPIYWMDEAAEVSPEAWKALHA